MNLCSVKRVRHVLLHMQRGETAPGFVLNNNIYVVVEFCILSMFSCNRDVVNDGELK